MKIKDAIEIINSNMRTIDCPTPLGRAIQTLIDATKDDDACVSTCQEVAVLRKHLAEKVKILGVAEIGDIITELHLGLTMEQKSKIAKAIVKAIEE